MRARLQRDTGAKVWFMKIGVRILVVLGISIAVGVVASCASPQQCVPVDTQCLVSLWIRSPCEIVSFTTTCRTPVDCSGGTCVYGPGASRQFNETCTVTALYDDNTTAVSHVTSVVDACGCTAFSSTATDFVPLKGSKCSPPSTDAGAGDASDASASDASTSDAGVDASSD